MQPIFPCQIVLQVVACRVFCYYNKQVFITVNKGNGAELELL